jgi:hypothetical protein
MSNPRKSRFMSLSYPSLRIKRNRHHKQMTITKAGAVLPEAHGPISGGLEGMRRDRAQATQQEEHVA